MKSKKELWHNILLSFNMKAKYLIIAFLTSVVFTSCKYEEGPVISLQSKTARVANHWKAEKVFDNGKDVTSDYDQYELIFAENGSATLVAKYKFGGASLTVDTKGTWSFEDAKETLKTVYENKDANRTYTILKLKSNEMWLKEKGGTVEYHLITAN